MYLINIDVCLYVCVCVVFVLVVCVSVRFHARQMSVILRETK